MIRTARTLATLLLLSTVRPIPVPAADLGGSTTGGSSRALSIDLCDPEAGFDLLPEITDEEVATLRRVAGPGDADLRTRLASTGIPAHRLRTWLPYLSLREPPGGTGWLRQHFGAPAEGKLRHAAWSRWTEGPLTTDLHLAGTATTRVTRASSFSGYGFATLRMGSGRAASVVAGACVPEIVGPDPWIDPFTLDTLGRNAGGRFLWRGAPDSFSGSIALAAGGAGLWHSPAGGCGGLLFVERGGVAVSFSSADRRGAGGSIVLRSGGRSIVAAAHAPRAAPASLRFLACAGDRWYIHCARAMEQRNDGASMRCESGMETAWHGAHLRVRLTAFDDAGARRPRTSLVSLVERNRFSLEVTESRSSRRLLARGAVEPISFLRIATVVSRTVDGDGVRFVSRHEIAWESSRASGRVALTGSPARPLRSWAVRFAVRAGGAAWVCTATGDGQGPPRSWRLEMERRIVRPRRR